MTNEELRTLVQKNYETFSALEGSQHIASMSSQLNLAEILELSNPRSILDWGSGIGTLIPLYLQLTESRIVAFERNGWCIDRLKANIDFDHRITLTKEPPLEQCFDLIVIDDKIGIREIYKLLKNSGRHAQFFVEGWRNLTLAQISILLPLFSMSGKARRFPSRLAEFGISGIFEKSGAVVIINRSNLFTSILSWYKRQRETRELLEFRRYLLSKFGIYRILGKLRLGVKIRRLIGAKPKSRKKAWLTQIENSTESK